MRRLRLSLATLTVAGGLVAAQLLAAVPAKAATYNILSNMSFEQDSFGRGKDINANHDTNLWVLWTVASFPPHGWVQRYCPYTTLAGAADGKCVLTLFDDDSSKRTAAFSQNVSASAGNTYCLTARVFSYNGNGGSGGWAAGIYMRFRNSSWTGLSGGKSYQVAYNSTGWRTIPTLKAVAPTGTRYVEVYVAEPASYPAHNPFNDWDYVKLDVNAC
jgi:hypothetical protein